jgi:dTDP-4-dehydrorhamnose reductase
MSIKRIMVLGSTGMLGHQVTNYFLSLDNYEVLNVSYKNKLNNDSIIINVFDLNLLEQFIHQIKPDFIVNCIGVLIGGSNDFENAIYINAYLPHKLKKIIDNLHSKLIHISTDCVFSGNKGNYHENDYKDGLGIYAQTKILGEIIDETNTTLRTSIIGPEIKENGEGLFHWFMNQKNNINGYQKEIWSGVSTIQLSKVIKCVIEKNITGLYHVTNNTSISKNDLLHLFNKYTNKNLIINPTQGKYSNKSLIDTRKNLGYLIPSYEEMVSEMVKNTRKYSNLYAYKEL